MKSINFLKGWFQAFAVLLLIGWALFTFGTKEFSYILQKEDGSYLTVEKAYMNLDSGGVYVLSENKISGEWGVGTPPEFRVELIPSANEDPGSRYFYSTVVVIKKTELE